MTWASIQRNISLMGLAAVLSACPKQTADLELDMARAAIADASLASKCAKETYQAAEAAIAEAEQLAEDGEVEAAKARAMEAKTLAEQAQASSPPGCDQPKVAEKEDDTPAVDASATDNIGMNLEGALDTVYFDYNDATIREDSKTVLANVAGILTKAPSSKIEIEGHCDVRGSTEYNLHLGERRARSVMKYLLAAGVKPDQINIISYGEERPEDLGLSEGAHQKNRRAELKKN